MTPEQEQAKLRLRLSALCRQFVKNKAAITARIQLICKHEWVLHQVAGEGHYCPKCNARNYELED